MTVALNTLMHWVIWFLPPLTFLTLWLWLMRRAGLFGHQDESMARMLEILQKQQRLLERIATAIEERNQLVRPR